MNLKRLALAALSSYALPAKVRAWADYSADLSPNVQKSGRNSGASSGPNCLMNAVTTCTIDFMNIPCGDYFIKRSECKDQGTDGIVDVTLRFEMCNLNPDDGIKPIFSRTEILVYDEKMSLNTSHLSKMNCRERLVKMKVDTCTRGKIVGSIKVEGKRDPRPGDAPNMDYYCYAWSFYKTKIIEPEGGSSGNVKPPTPRLTVAPTSSPIALPTPVPTPVPTPFPNISFEFAMECFFENEKGDRDFRIPCEMFDFEAINETDLLRNMKLEYTIKNTSIEPINLTKITAEVADEIPRSLFEIETVQPMQKATAFQIFEIDFADFNGTDVDIAAVISAVGEESGNDGREEDDISFTVPALDEAEDVQLSFDPQAECFINDASFSQTCAERMSTLRRGDDECTQDIIFRYKLRNDGTTCEQVNFASGSIDRDTVFPEDIIVPEQNLRLDHLGPNDKSLCENESIFILHPTRLNLCELFAEELRAIIKINPGDSTFDGSAFLLLPESNSIPNNPPTWSPTEEGDFELVLDNAECHTFDSNSERKPCQEYIDATNSLLRTEYPPECFRPVQFSFDLRNVGNKCRPVKGDFETSVNGEVVTIEIDKWSEDKLQLCPDSIVSGDKVTINRPSSNENVCAMAGQRVMFEVEVNGRTATSFIQFPFPTLTTPAPTPTPLIIDDGKCNSHPKRLKFELTESKCKDTSNSQWEFRKRRHTRGLRSTRINKNHRGLPAGKGSGGNTKKSKSESSSEKSKPCPTPTPPSGEDETAKPFQCEDNERFKNSPYTVEIKDFENNTVLVVKKIDIGECIEVGDGLNDIPGASVLWVEIRDKKDKIVQRSMFDGSCNTAMKLGDAFGALTVKGFENDDGVAALSL